MLVTFQRSFPKHTFKWVIVECVRGNRHIVEVLVRKIFFFVIDIAFFFAVVDNNCSLKGGDEGRETKQKSFYERYERTCSTQNKMGLYKSLMIWWYGSS